MAETTTFAIYAPPKDGLPFLFVAIHATGTVTAAPFTTAEEANAYYMDQVPGLIDVVNDPTKPQKRD